MASVDQGDTGETPHQVVTLHGIDLVMITLPKVKRSSSTKPRRWVVERDFGWLSRFRCLTRDDERLPETGAAPPFLAVACLMLQRMLTLAVQGP